MTGRARGPAALLLALLLAGCGLPVQGGVRAVRPVAPERAERGDIRVLPPGPRPGADAREIVLGFLGAQTSVDSGHALAREFLDRSLAGTWDDRAGVVVYDPASLELTASAPDDSAVTVRATTLATIDANGSYALTPGTSEDVYRVRRDDRGQLRLVTVPSGLRLTPAGANRTLRPRDVYYLAPPATGRPSEQLAPDRVFLPVDAAPDALVRRLLAGPAAALRPAVVTAVPPGTSLRRPVTTSDGVLTVDLTGPEVGGLPPPLRRPVAAQLVWTLLDGVTGASRVRLLVDGRPYEVPGAGPLQDRSDWVSFDPEGAATRGGALYVADRRVERLDGTPQRGELSDGRVPVDAVAASPSTGRLAVVTRGAGTAVVRTATPGGPSAVVLQRPAVSTLSWGSGDRGLWTVAAGAGGPEVVLVPDGGPPAVVPLVPPAGAGPLQVLRVSRDGVRAAAVFGDGAGRRLYVGQVASDERGLRLEGFSEVAPGAGDVADVSWETGTTLVALAQLGTPNRLPVRVAVDGSLVEPVRTLGLDGQPQTVSAAPDRPLLVGTVVDGRPALLVEDNGLFRLQSGIGSAPAYPG